MTITLKQGDCLELMKELPDESVDLVLTDPPYFRIMKQEWNGKKHEWDNQWENRSAYLNWVSKIMKEIKRVIKNNGSFYIFADDKMSCYVRLEAERIGFRLINEIVWVKKNNMTIKGWYGYKLYAPITERILFFGFPESDYELASDSLVSTVFNPLKQYLIEEKKKTELTGDEINKLVGTASMAGRHYFSDSQWHFPIKEHYERMQLTFNAVYRKLDTVDEIEKFTNEELISKLSGYDVLRKDYEELRKDYEELRRYFNPSSNFTDV
ncbi:MAG: DNA-methyltransferase [Thermoplasmataceae archaeon]